MKEGIFLASFIAAHWVFFALYAAAINLFSFILYGIDKLKAKRRAWRIPEATLLICAAIGGALGAFCGIRLFHHKTRHKKFAVLVPLLLILQLALVIWVIVAAW